jgi:hypothetical protein
MSISPLLHHGPYNPQPKHVLFVFGGCGNIHNADQEPLSIDVLILASMLMGMVNMLYLSRIH